MAEVIFKRKKLIENRLTPFGFSLVDGIYEYTADIAGGQMRMLVKITKDGSIKTNVFDLAVDDEYVLHLVPDSAGEFVGRVREDYNSVLEDIKKNCFEDDVFKSEQTKRIIEHVRETYHDELEYLWEKFPDNAILRRKDNSKWYAALLTTPLNRLGFDSNETAEIIDLRIQPESMEELLAQPHYYPGWHMNKKHWYTVILDGSLPDEELFERIKTSYELAK